MCYYRFETYYIDKFLKIQRQNKFYLKFISFLFLPNIPSYCPNREPPIILLFVIQKNPGNRAIAACKLGKGA